MEINVIRVYGTKYKNVNAPEALYVNNDLLLFSDNHIENAGKIFIDEAKKIKTTETITFKPSEYFLESAPEIWPTTFQELIDSYSPTVIYDGI